MRTREGEAPAEPSVAWTERVTPARQEPRPPRFAPRANMNSDPSDGSTSLKFVATPEKGEVSALLRRPAAARALLVLGHGASTNMRHAFLSGLSEALATAGVATFRYQFPY